MQQASISRRRSSAASLQGKCWADLSVRFCSLELKGGYTENTRSLPLLVRISGELSVWNEHSQAVAIWSCFLNRVACSLGKFCCLLRTSLLVQFCVIVLAAIHRLINTSKIDAIE